MLQWNPWYFFNEAWAVEGFFHYTLNTANSTFTAISQTSPAALPQVREYRWAAGGMLQWNPWYSKINVFNSILHFDWHFGVGAAWMQNEVDTRSSTGAASAFTPADQLTFVWGTGHRYYVSESVCVRFDLTGYIYRAPLRGTAGEVLWFSHYTIGLGLGLLL
jgi:outer membrane beta-barrel protein